MARRMRLKGESIESAQRRNKLNTARMTFREEERRSQKLEKLNKAIKQRAKSLSTLRQAQDNMTKVPYSCLYCGGVKGLKNFYYFNPDKKIGVCKTCHNQRTKLVRRMEKTSEVAGNAQRIFADAISEVMNLFQTSNLPKESQLISDVITGITNGIIDWQLKSRLYALDANTKQIPQTANIINGSVVYPVLLYVYGLTDFNQVQTAKILGWSRNALRSKFKEIEERCPDLIKKYDADENWPTFNKRAVKEYKQIIGGKDEKTASIDSVISASGNSSSNNNQPS